MQEQLGVVWEWKNNAKTEGWGENGETIRGKESGVEMSEWGGNKQSQGLFIPLSFINQVHFSLRLFCKSIQKSLTL